MPQTFRKIKRVQPLINLKKQRMDEEAVILTQIRAEKAEIVKSMKESQRRYMDGIEELNKIRVSTTRTNLHTIEESLDYVKSQWYSLYKKVQDAESREKSQLNHLIAAERDLKSVEKLREKYELEAAQDVKKQDQKNMDEAALRKFSSRVS